jgi:hypothetical protein
MEIVVSIGIILTLNVLIFVWRDIKLRSLPNSTNNLEGRVQELESKISQIYLKLSSRKI